MGSKYDIGPDLLRNVPNFPKLSKFEKLHNLAPVIKFSKFSRISSQYFGRYTNTTLV